jgi:hydrogenase nickel incorporation protein HypA/HybF
MHELTLTRGLIEALEGEAERQSFARVLKVTLEIGVLSHVDPEAIRFCFDVSTKGTLAAEAELVIERPGGQAFCLDCLDTVEIVARGSTCPRCGGGRLVVNGGQELRIRELEVA